MAAEHVVNIRFEGEVKATQERGVKTPLDTEPGKNERIHTMMVKMGRGTDAFMVICGILFAGALTLCCVNIGYIQASGLGRLAIGMANFLTFASIFTGSVSLREYLRKQLRQKHHLLEPNSIAEVGWVPLGKRVLVSLVIFLGAMLFFGVGVWMAELSDDDVLNCIFAEMAMVQATLLLLFMEHQRADADNHEKNLKLDSENTERNSRIKGLLVDWIYGSEAFYYINVVCCLVTIVLCSLNLKSLDSGNERVMATAVYSFTVYAVAILSIFVRDYERTVLEDECELNSEQILSKKDYSSQYYRITLATFGLFASLVLFINYIIVIFDTGHSLNSFFSECFLMIDTAMMMYVLHNRADGKSLRQY